MTVSTQGSLLLRLLPAGAQGVDALADDVDTWGRPVGPLVGQERDLVRASSPRRAAEVRTARHCAREALGALGVRPGPVLRAPSGAPVWPRGVVGSITHCRGYRAAVVAPARVVAAVGIDAERWRPLPALVVDAVVLPGEREQGRHATGLPLPLLACLMFSVKEAVGKAWCGAGGAPVGFRDVVVAPGAGRFSARVVASPAPGVPRRYEGRWVRVGDLLVVAATPSGRPGTVVPAALRTGGRAARLGALDAMATPD